MGTLLAFTTVALSVLILRYVPPNEMPLSPSLQESLQSVSLQFGGNIAESDGRIFQSPGSSENDRPLLNEKAEIHHPLILEGIALGNKYNTCMLLRNGKYFAGGTCGVLLQHLLK